MTVINSISVKSGTFPLNFLLVCVLIFIKIDLISNQCGHEDCTTSYLNDYISILNSKSECIVSDAEVSSLFFINIVISMERGEAS